MIYIPLPNKAITAVGAAYAEEVADSKMGISPRRVKMDDYPQDRPDPVPDEIPSPVGPVPFAFMTILAILYGSIKTIRRKRFTTSAA